MVLTFWGVSSLPGHIGMSPSVTGSELLSLTHWLFKLLFISVEYTQQAHTLATTSVPTHSLSKQAVHYIAHLLSGSHVCLIVSLSWMNRWFPMKQKCNHRKKALHIWSFYQGMFGKPFYKPQLPTDTWSRKSLENINACLIVTFSWSFYKMITFKQLSLTKK